MLPMEINKSFLANKTFKPALAILIIHPLILVVLNILGMEGNLQYFITSFILLLLLEPVVFSVSEEMLKIGKDETHIVKAKELLKGYSHIGSILVISIVTGAIIILGCGLLLIPGLYLTAVMALVIPLWVEDKSKGVMELIKESNSLMKGHKKDYLVKVISNTIFYFLIWAILGGIGYTLSSNVVITIILDILIFQIMRIRVDIIIQAIQVEKYLEIKNN